MIIPGQNRFYDALHRRTVYCLMHRNGNIRNLPAIGIVAETGCCFLRELSFPDTVHAGLAVEKLGNSSVIHRIGLFRNGEAEPAAIGRFVHVYVDSKTRRPVPVPPQIRAALTALQEGYVWFGALP